MQHPPLDREIMITEENSNFVAANVESIAQNEPQWMRESRLHSLSTYNNLPMPGRKDEEWRKTDISDLEFSRYAPAYTTNEEASTAGMPEDFQNLYNSLENNVLLCSDGQSISKPNSQEGIIFTDMKTAVAEHPELVQKYFTKSSSHIDEDKFSSLQSAFWNSGHFLYVPKGVHVEAPLWALYGLRSTDVAHFPHVIIVVDEGASLTYCEHFTSTASDQQLFVNSKVEIFVEAGAQLQYVSVHNFAEEVYNLANRRAIVGRDGVMNWFVGTFGGTLTKSLISSVLKEQGAETEMLGASIGDAEQFIDQNTFQIHDAPNTKSDLLFKNAVKREGYTLYRGVISIAQHAQKSDAYQTNRNLMLGEEARTESIPALEIIANDVRCSHGASVSQVDPEHLFYLQCRGLSKEQGVRLIVDGYFDSLLKKIKNEDIVKHVQELIYSKTDLS